MEYRSKYYQEYKHRMIDAVKLACHPVKLFYAEIDGSIDFDIAPSKYAGVVIKRIKRNHYYKKYPYKI